MGNPPPAVKLALESICLLLGEQAADWRTIRGVIIKDNFISTVVNFSTEDISYVEQLCLPCTISPLVACGLSTGTGDSPATMSISLGYFHIILGDPGADSGDEGKSKRAGKYGTNKLSGTNQKPERRRPFGTGLIRHCPQGLFSPFFTFLRAIFSRPVRLSLVPTNCPWVSEDAFI